MLWTWQKLAYIYSYGHNYNANTSPEVPVIKISAPNGVIVKHWYNHESTPLVNSVIFGSQNQYVDSTVYNHY